MNIEIINTGSELMLGRVLNTHQQWLCRQLADRGMVVTRQVAVADTATEIREAVREALGRADLVLVTGGLGPTSDDITRDLIAGLLGKHLHEDATVLARIESFFAERKRSMPVSTRVQAMVPESAVVLQNAHGTAPGLVMELNPNPLRSDARKSLLVMLPGPPRELRPMFLEQVIPLLHTHFPPESAFVCRTLKTTGLGVSIVEKKISGSLRPLTDAGLELGYCARVGEVDVRLVARGGRAIEAVAAAENIIRAAIGSHIYGVDDESLEEILVRTLTVQKKKVALAESCTGGFVAHRLTNVPGASAVFLSGLVTYSNEEKIRLLGVPPPTLAEFGAVSRETVRAMAEGARNRSGADFALAVTGIAGPGGGSSEKPVGTVFIALATPEKTLVKLFTNRYDRETFKFVTSQQALEMLRQELQPIAVHAGS